mmetsp:Transcript_103486/g.178284  ORF Transcript_103486/g.178284 Transcript_103486/m.178284 type:complete len:227 (-) Transcript_103486:507-1187(-)
MDVELPPALGRSDEGGNGFPFPDTHVPQDVEMRAVVQSVVGQEAVKLLTLHGLRASGHCITDPSRGHLRSDRGLHRDALAMRMDLPLRLVCGGTGDQEAGVQVTVDSGGRHGRLIERQEQDLLELHIGQAGDHPVPMCVPQPCACHFYVRRPREHDATQDAVVCEEAPDVLADVHMVPHDLVLHVRVRVLEHQVRLLLPRQVLRGERPARFVRAGHHPHAPVQRHR